MLNQWLDKVDGVNQRSLLIYLVSTSMLLAAWMQHIQHGWINPDTVLYLEQGRLFALGEWRQAVNVFNWPLYGACIAAVHKITSFNIHQSAQLLNMLFFGIATFSFLSIIKLADGNNRTLLLGAALLFSSQYIVGDALEMLMRDQGFWAFYLTAILFFIRYCLHQKFTDALLWQVSIIIATLFRIEAILYLILLPLFYIALNAGSLKQRIAKIFNSYSLSIFAGIIITIILATQPESTMSQFGRLDEVFTSDLFQKVTGKLTTQAAVMGEKVLGRYLDDFAVQGLLLTFIYVIIAKIISTTGLITTLLSISSIWPNDHKIATIPRQTFLSVLAIALLASFLIIMKVFVLSGRYVIALSLILILLASFALSDLSSRKEKKLKIVFSILCLIICLGLVKNILPKRDGYNYRQDAISWLQQHNQNKAPVFYDESRLRYFANEPFEGGWKDTWQAFLTALNNGSIKNKQYMLINHSKKNPERITFVQNNLPEFKEVHRCYNRKKKKFIVIYKRQ